MTGVQTCALPIFSSGTIFSYLLLRKNLPLKDNERFYKGAKRVLILLVIGYLLRFNPNMLWDLDNFSFLKYQGAFGVDALHCIAIGLGLILFSYILNKVTKIYIWIFYAFFAFMAFYLYPEVIKHDWLEILPLPLANYLTKGYGSNFPIIPWTGFVMWGALLGYLLSKRANLAFNNIFAVSILLLGVALHYYSGAVLNFLFSITGDTNFEYLLNHNFLYYHLGNSFIVLGILALISNFVKIPAILSSVGKKTMMIYVVHIFVIYGTGYNKGLAYYFGKSLEPVPVVLTAVGILIFFIVLVYYWEKV